MEEHKNRSRRKYMQEKRVKVRERKIEEKDWWDAKCKGSKRKVKKAYRRWRKGIELKEKYLERKR